MRRLLITAAVAAQMVVQMGVVRADDAACTAQRAAGSLAMQDLAHYTERDDATRKDALGHVRIVRKVLQDAVTACAASGSATDLLLASGNMSRLETSLSTAKSERLHDIKGWEQPLKLGSDQAPPAAAAAPAPDAAGADDAAPPQP